MVISKSFSLAGKLVSQPSIDSVRFMQVENLLRWSRVSKQIESAMGKG